VAEALIALARDKFQVPLLRALDATDGEGIQDVLNNLEDSPTHVTFLSMTIVYLSDFLNTAGKRGMHQSHLFLSMETQIVDDLDPPSEGGIWVVDYGEDSKPDSPLAMRYAAKDTTPHIEAMDYGLADNYDILTYWGAYAYDAVLAAVYGYAAAKNKSDGEQVLASIMNVSLDNANTGLLEFDENGDRIGARIPIFFLTPEGTKEQFAVYHDGKVDFLQDPMWPGGSRTQPTNLIQQSETSNVYRLVIAILFPLVAVMLLLLGWRLWKMRKRARDISAAPKTGPCCIIFTDIQSSSALWSVAPAEMSKALNTHHAVVRACIVAHGAYEVKTIGDSFMVASNDPDKALQLAVDIQEKLHNADWDPFIDACYKDIIVGHGEHDSSVWHGLRVRVSMHYGEPEIRFDESLKGYDYYGNMVNKAARIEGLAHGGQVVVSAAFKDALKDEHPQVTFEKLGDHELRGCPGVVCLWQVTPKQLASRQFPLLRTGIATDGDDTDDFNSDIGEWANHDFDISTVAGSDAFGRRQHSTWFKTLLSVLKIKQRKEIVRKLCVAWHVQDEDQLVRRVAKVSCASERVHGQTGSVIGSSSSEIHEGKPLLSSRNLGLHTKRLSLVNEGESEGRASVSDLCESNGDIHHAIEDQGSIKNVDSA
jgi:class 3 adenylate cyclase